MEELFRTLLSPASLLGLVLGIVGGIAANYFQRGIDNRLGKWSASRRARLQRYDENFQKRLRLLKSNPELVQLYVAREQRLRWAAAGRLVIGAVLGTLLVTHLLQKAGAPYSPAALVQAGAMGVLAVLALWAGVGHLEGANYHGAVLDRLMDWSLLESQEAAKLEAQDAANSDKLVL